ncbi:MAG: hypothetical protein ACO2ZL_03625, partial [Flavobacteriales bacterium]
YEYKFINGNAWGQDEVVPEACGTPNGLGGFNRMWSFESVDDASPLAVCWYSCTSCNPIGPEDDGESFCGPGTAWDATLQLCVGTMEEDNCPEDIDGDGEIAVTDLLALLSAFGASCPTN